MADFVEESFFEAPDDTGVLGHDTFGKWENLDPLTRQHIGSAIGRLIFLSYHNGKIKNLPEVFLRFFEPILTVDNVHQMFLVDGTIMWASFVEDYTMSNILNTLHYIGHTEEIEAIFNEHAPEFFTLRINRDVYAGPLVQTAGKFTDATK